MCVVRMCGGLAAVLSGFSIAAAAGGDDHVSGFLVYYRVPSVSLLPSLPRVCGKLATIFAPRIALACPMRSWFGQPQCKSR